jgi:hypothetical protein
LVSLEPGSLASKVMVFSLFSLFVFSISGAACVAAEDSGMLGAGHDACYGGMDYQAYSQRR